MGTDLKKMKIFVGLLASALGAPAPAIIGGSNASDGQFPHQVTLQNRGSHYCGGSIINTNKVMCAAHCKQSGTLTAGAGSASRTRQRQTKNFTTQLAHPSYNSRTIDYDYMIITVSGSFSYDNYVKPIKIVNSSSSELANNTACKTSGWGYSQHNAAGNPGTIHTTLQWTNINCITNSECKKVWGTSTIGSRQQCANSDRVTSCMGDSGGPLTVRQSGEDRLQGNVSWGHSKCSTTGYPGVYSRNADPTINSWIKSNANVFY